MQRAMQWVGKGAAALAFTCAAVTAQAAVMSDGDVYNFNWSYASGTSAGLLTGNGSITADFTDATTLVLTINLTNTSTENSSRLTAFGFGIDPDATAAVFSDVADGGMIAGGFGNIPAIKAVEVCAWGGPNCQGGGNGGIDPDGASDQFVITLTGPWGASAPSVNIDPLGFKYQTDFGSFEFTTVCTNGRCETTVPEPGSLALLGMGLAGLALVRRRRSIRPE